MDEATYFAAAAIVGTPTAAYALAPPTARRGFVRYSPTSGAVTWSPPDPIPEGIGYAYEVRRNDPAGEPYITRSGRTTRNATDNDAPAGTVWYVRLIHAANGERSDDLIVSET